MKVVYKYKVKSPGLFHIKMPENAEILKVDAQKIGRYDTAYEGGYKKEGFVWALVDTDNPLEKRQFMSVFTGEEISEERWEKVDHIGTYIVERSGMVLVCHLFELLSYEEEE